MIMIQNYISRGMGDLNKLEAKNIKYDVIDNKIRSYRKLKKLENYCY